MRKFSLPWILLAALATVQAIVALVLLSWAAPLFFDPPLLGNGVAIRARELQDLVAAPGSSPRLKGIGEQYHWLFWRHVEGIEGALLASAALLGGSVLIWIVLLLQPRALPSETAKERD